MPPRANSCKLALARISAPALRILATVKASAGGSDVFMVTLPPDVGMSKVLKLSLGLTGMQFSVPTLAGLARQLASISAAVSIALGLTVMIACSAGPC